jgi:enediyne biosynthesis protein E4
LDLAIGNGDAFTRTGSLPLLLANQGNGKFVDAAQKAGAVFKTRINARGNAVLDFDNDGRLDLLFTVLADRPFLLRNRAPVKNHWFKVDLQGTRSNRHGYGALLTLKAGDLTLRTEALSATGFLTQGDPRPHFGLGKQGKVDRLEIRWPSGQTQVLTNLSANQILKVREPNL